jgi:hypothetical protein
MMYKQGCIRRYRKGLHLVAFSRRTVGNRTLGAASVMGPRAVVLKGRGSPSEIGRDVMTLALL